MDQAQDRGEFIQLKALANVIYKAGVKARESEGTKPAEAERNGSVC